MNLKNIKELTKPQRIIIFYNTNLSIRIFKDHMKNYSGSDQNYINQMNQMVIQLRRLIIINDFYKIKK